MSDLKLSIVTNEDTIKDVLFILDEWNDGFENFISDLDSYELYDLLKLAQKNWWIYGAYSDELEGICIYQWGPGDIVNLHVCTFTKNRNWEKFYKNKILPEIAKHAKYQMILLKKEDTARLKLFESYGFKFEWIPSINFHKSLYKL